jgi:hypothetical protein
MKLCPARLDENIRRAGQHGLLVARRAALIAGVPGRDGFSQVDRGRAFLWGVRSSARCVSSDRGKFAPTVAAPRFRGRLSGRRESDR